MKKRKWQIIAAVIVLAAGGYFWYSRSNSNEEKTEYVTAEASKGMLTSSISGSGNIIVDNQANIDPTITGTVSNLSVKVGDSVSQGQFLFDIINDDLAVSVAKASATYESAKNSLESAEIDKDDAEAKYEKAKDQDEEDGDTYTSEELDVLEDKIDLAESKVIQAQKSLAASGADYRNIQSDAAKRRVVSPIDGTVQEVNIKNGDDLSKISSGTTRLVPIIIGDIGTLKAEVEVNEVDIAKVSIGQKVMLTLDALDGTEFSGKVEKINSLGTVTQGVVSYNVTIAFDTLDQKIKPDMSVSASIITDVKQDVVKVPSSAVKTENNDSYVEVLVDGVPQRKTVTVGVSNDTETEITNGLSAGDEVITETIDSSNTASTSSSSGSSGSRNSGGANIRVPGMRGFGG